MTGLQCVRCGSRRQRNLQVMLDGTCLCKRCATGGALPCDGKKSYRYADNEQIGETHDIDDPRFDSKEFQDKKDWQRKQTSRLNHPKRGSDEPDWQSTHDRRRSRR